VVTYREPDPECLEELARERRRALEQAAREHAADVALVKAMKNPFHGLRGAVPPTLPRVMLVAACTVLSLPLVLTLLGYAVNDHDVIGVLVWTALLGGTLAGLVALVTSVVVFVRRSSVRGVAIFSFAAGLLGIPWAWLCAAAIALSHWRW
jgi:hypothetical protein